MGQWFQTGFWYSFVLASPYLYFLFLSVHMVRKQWTDGYEGADSNRDKE